VINPIAHIVVQEFDGFGPLGIDTGGF